MMRSIKVAAIQMECSQDRQANIERAERLVRQAAGQGARIILLQELFETLYFCQKELPDYLGLATEIHANPAIQYFSRLAGELDVVLPISFFEKRTRRALTALPSSMRMAVLWAFTARRIFRTGPVMRRSITSAPAIRASRCGIPVTAKSASASAGINGSPKPRAAWR